MELLWRLFKNIESVYPDKEQKEEAGPLNHDIFVFKENLTRFNCFLNFNIEKCKSNYNKIHNRCNNLIPLSLLVQTRFIITTIQNPAG